MTVTAVEIDSVTKTFGEGTSHVVSALREVSLTIGNDEFFTLLGPSGCGKSTLLRLIAGFERPTTGSILLFGEHMESLPPNRRSTNMVFQHYALFPHLSVAENVAFGLKRLKRPKGEVDEVVWRMLRLVKLEQFAERQPGQLSGGQQQRVALARALAPGPKVVLLDEPLSALDLKLRQAMRLELKQIQKESGITFVFVTHDQEEALSMSDRIAVMSKGEVQQIGRPREIYETPTNRFVAAFIGDANFIDARIVKIEDGVVVCEAGASTTLMARNLAGHAVGDAVTLFSRPEKVVLHRNDEPGCQAIPGEVRSVVYLGNATAYSVDIGNGIEILARDKNLEDGAQDFAVGDHLHLTIDATSLKVLSQ